MKQRLTLVESAELIKMGVDPTLATDMVIESIPIEEIDGVMRGIETPFSVFYLADIIALLPQRIIVYDSVHDLNIWSQSDGWCAGYRSVVTELCQCRTELIDALFDLLKEVRENPQYTKL